MSFHVANMLRTDMQMSDNQNKSFLTEHSYIFFVFFSFYFQFFFFFVYLACYISTIKYTEEMREVLLPPQ